MQWWDSANTLYRIASWLTVITFVAPLLFGILALLAQNRARQLESVVIESLRSANRTLEERTRSRSLNRTPELIAALSADPRGTVHVIADSYDGEEAHEYLEEWRKLFTDTGWPNEGLLSLAPTIPRGAVTLAIRNASIYALHLRDVLLGSNLSISIATSDAPFLQQFNELPEDVFLLIGRRP